MIRRRKEEIDKAYKVFNQLYSEICSELISRSGRCGWPGCRDDEVMDEETLKIIVINSGLGDCLRVLRDPLLFKNLNKL